MSATKFSPTLATDKSQKTEIPKSCLSVNPVSMHINLDVTYHLWDAPCPAPHNQLEKRTPYFHPLFACNSPVQMRLDVADLTFSRFRMLVYHHLEERRFDAKDVIPLIKSAHKKQLLEWQCMIPDHPAFGADKNFAITDEDSFHHFAMSAGFHFGDGTPSVAIIMQDPVISGHDSEQSLSPRGHDCKRLLSPHVVTMQTPPSVHIVGNTSPGPLVALLIEEPIKIVAVSNQDHRSLHTKSDRIHLRNTKKAKKFQDVDMDTFPTMCHIPHSNYKTQYLIQKHRLHNWLVFKVLSSAKLISLKYNVSCHLLFSSNFPTITA
ncbi:hypothetical protein PCASD_06957 [Puccinia coronata f. sp. avenae]|uniref:Uncharacterized protein n=1 Tax=Puccinia coronata f. sp. avenae TaxID=200324 RepID=A0A2N5V4T4_9BASI|nr:hypothetical protein PCASD_06957 [Puccinia coronata f. sp. avenae]